MDKGTIVLCLWFIGAAIGIVFVIINTIKRDRKYRVGIRLLEKYCKKNALYNVIPKDNAGDAYQIQFNALLCNLNCTLFVKCYIVKNNYISEYCLPLKTVWMLFNDGNNDVHMLQLLTFNIF